MTQVRDMGGHVAGSHIVELQSLRGVAAMVVVLGHCISYYLSPDWYRFVKTLVNTQAAVEIFFVLSGFVLGKSIARRGFSKPAILAYLVRRLFRIYPALIVASALALFYVAALHYKIPGPYDSLWFSERFRHDRFTALHIVASFAGALAFLIPPVWTVFVELVGSIILPPLVYLSGARPRWFLASLVGALALGLIVGGRVYYHLDMYVFNFALGVALNLPAPRLIAALQRRRRLAGGLALTAAALLIVSRALLHANVFSPLMNVYDTVLCAIIVFALGRVELRVGWLQARLVCWIGDISFSIYLLHFSVMCIVAKILFLTWPGMPAAVGPIPAGYILFAVTVPPTLLLAHLSYWWIERRGIALGDAVLVKLGLGARALATA